MCKKIGDMMDENFSVGEFVEWLNSQKQYYKDGVCLETGPAYAFCAYESVLSYLKEHNIIR